VFASKVRGGYMDGAGGQLRTLTIVKVSATPEHTKL
jgi:hypothetical protein